MNSNLSEKISVRLFIGIEFTQDLQFLLSRNRLWKQASVSNTHILEETRFQDKQYLGFFVKEEMIPIKALQDKKELIQKTLAEYEPTIPINSLKFSLFPQVFVS